MLHLIKTKDVSCFRNIILIYLPFIGVLLYELLMEIRIEVFFCCLGDRSAVDDGHRHQWGWWNGSQWFQVLKAFLPDERADQEDFQYNQDHQCSDDLVDCLCVSSVKKLCQFSGPVHGFHLDVLHLRFVCWDHVINGNDVASWIDQNVSPYLICHGLIVILAGHTWFVLICVLSQLENLLPGLGDFEFVGSLDCYGIMVK